MCHRILRVPACSLRCKLLLCGDAQGFSGTCKDVYGTLKTAVAAGTMSWKLQQECKDYQPSGTYDYFERQVNRQQSTAGRDRTVRRGCAERRGAQRWGGRCEASWVIWEVSSRPHPLTPPSRPLRICSSRATTSSSPSYRRSPSSLAVRRTPHPTPGNPHPAPGTRHPAPRTPHPTPRTPATRAASLHVCPSRASLDPHRTTFPPLCTAPARPGARAT